MMGDTHPLGQSAQGAFVESAQGALTRLDEGIEFTIDATAANTGPNSQRVCATCAVESHPWSTHTVELNGKVTFTTPPADEDMHFASVEDDKSGQLVDLSSVPTNAKCSGLTCGTQKGEWGGSVPTTDEDADLYRIIVSLDAGDVYNVQILLWLGHSDATPLPPPADYVDWPLNGTATVKLL